MRRRVAAALAGLAAVAVVAGVVMLRHTGEPQAAPEPAAVVPTQPAPAPPSPTEQASAAATPPEGNAQPPGTVRLPHGGTATLVRREVTPDGTLPIPDGLAEATWWGAGLGADRGVTLLSGHVNWGGRTGPFAELWQDRPGQEITVTDQAGQRWVYRITDVVTLHKDELPRHAERLFSQEGRHRLVLVTCGGDYVGGTDGYRDNRIVTAQLVTRP